MKGKYCHDQDRWSTWVLLQKKKGIDDGSQLFLSPFLDCRLVIPIDFCPSKKEKKSIIDHTNWLPAPPKLILFSQLHFASISNSLYSYQGIKPGLYWNTDSMPVMMAYFVMEGVWIKSDDRGSMHWFTSLSPTNCTNVNLKDYRLTINERADLTCVITTSIDHHNYAHS